MRIPKRVAAVGLAGIVAAGAFGVSPAFAAQNYAPKCDATANVLDPAEFTVSYKIVCTDFSQSSTVATQGDLNGGNWTAKSYAEGTWVKYSDGVWYKAALDVTASDEPTKPAKDDEGNDVVVWIAQTADTSTAWSASSTSSTATAGSYKSGYVVNYTPNGGSKGWYTANADTTAADVPGTSSKWDVSATAYKGPQPAGTKVLTVKYPALVSGYSLITLNNQLVGFDTEPVILTADGSGPALNQTQYCNGQKPGYGLSCTLNSAVNLYGKKSDGSFVKLTGGTLAAKVSGSYFDLASTNLFGDNSVSGSPSTAIGSTDFLDLGALGRPANSGKAIVPAQSGSQITGEFELDSTPCLWGDAGLRMVVTTTDPEGQVAAPIEVSLAQSKYYRLVKDSDGNWVQAGIAKGCTFDYKPFSTQVYYRDGSGKVVKLPKPKRSQGTQTITAD